jgi:predicted nucleic acid-binding protein
LFYALIIFIGAHVYTIDKDLTWDQCQRAVSVSVDAEVMECVRDQEV